MNRSRTVIICRNPRAGAHSNLEAIEKLERSLSAKGFEVLVQTDPDALQKDTERLKQAESLQAVVAAGGDGTISLLVNLLPPGIPIAILPLGTENLLAKYLNLSADPKKLAEAIDRGATLSLDAGSANGKIFLIMASCGFDAEVVRKLHASRSGHIRHWSYFRPIYNSIWDYHYARLRLEVDQGRSSFEARWAFVFNIPRYALNLPIAADAEPTDNWLDLCTFSRGNLWHGLFYFLLILFRLHRRFEQSRHTRFQQLRIEAADPRQEVPYQLDGDPGGILPLEIKILPRYFQVVLPVEENHSDRE
jgi:diacylglycerol kinase (ATP)